MKLKRDLAMFLSVMKNTFGYVETFRSAIVIFLSAKLN